MPAWQILNREQETQVEGIWFKNNCQVNIHFRSYTKWEGFPEMWVHAIPRLPGGTIQGEGAARQWKIRKVEAKKVEEESPIASGESPAALFAPHIRFVLNGDEVLTIEIDPRE